MLKRRLIYLLFLLVVPTISFAQSDSRIGIKGLLLPTSEDLFLESIHVYNKQSGKGILSDSDGNFKLNLQLGDTIAVSAIHIEPIELVVEQMHLNDAFITIAIHPNMEHLKEVRLTNRSLTGNLGLDMKTIPTEPVITSMDLGYAPSTDIMTKGERDISYISSSSINLLYAVLSGEMQNAKRRLAIEKRKRQQSVILKKVPLSFYKNQLKIVATDIPHFLEFCETEQDIDNIAQMEVFALIEFLEKTAVLYRESYPEIF